MTAPHYPRDEFFKYLEGFRKGVANGIPVTDDKRRELFRRFDVLVREHDAEPLTYVVGDVRMFKSPLGTSREELELEFGAPGVPAEPPPEAGAPAPGRQGHDWPVELIRDILDRVRQGKGRPAILRELSATPYPNGLGATDYIVREYSLWPAGLTVFNGSENAGDNSGIASSRSLRLARSARKGRRRARLRVAPASHVNRLAIYVTNNFLH